jgi:phosphatidylethanolamine-binding protein (PEBP) family uncharacterized protein
MKSFISIIVALCIAAPACAESGKFTLTSPDIKPMAFIKNEQVFNGFGCSGKNISPALAWKNPPAGTKSFALMVYDPDAPTGSGWWHWIIYNIPADINSLPEGAGTPDGLLLPPVVSRPLQTSASPVTVAPVRLSATSPIATFSRFTL